MEINVNTYTKHNWVDNSSPDLEAEILNEIETGIGDNNDSIKALAAAVVNQIVNDPDKIASMAALYAVNQTLGNLSTTVTNINSNLTALSTITNGTITMTVGTNSGSALKKKGVGICLLQLSIIISPGDIPTYSDQKIANASFHPQAGFLKNITLYSTATGNSISGRIGMNTSGDISLYVTTTIPTGGVIIQESIEYFA